MATQPTTWQPTSAGSAGTDPHAESHEADGSDPVLGPIRYLGAVVLESDFAYNGETTFIDSDLTLDVRTRGGQLMIMFTGSIFLSHNNVNTTTTRFQCMLDGVAITTPGGSDITQALQVRADGTDPGVLGIAAPSSIIWLTSPTPDDHTITLQVVVNDASDNAYLLTGASLIVFELLPIRRV